MSRRLNVNQIFDPVLTVNISATNVRHLVYLLVANRPIRYGRKYSRIIYVGTTERGVRRIASSASKRIQQAVDTKVLRGLRRLEAYVVWAKTRSGLHPTKKSQNLWRVLERAILIKFCNMHGGQRPRLNETGHKMKDKGEFNIFREKRIGRIIDRYK